MMDAMHGMHARPPDLTGVLYAEDFDLPPPGSAGSPGPAAPEPTPAPVIRLEPTFSLVELQRAVDEAVAEGRALERDAALREMERRRTEALASIAGDLRQAVARSAGIAADVATATARTVLQAVATLLPDLASRHAASELSALLRLLLPAMENVPSLHIRVHPTLIDGLRNDLATLSVTGSTEIVWAANASLEPGDIVVRWQDGTMVRDTAALNAAITALLDPKPVNLDNAMGYTS